MSDYLTVPFPIRGPIQLAESVIFDISRGKILNAEWTTWHLRQVYTHFLNVLKCLPYANQQLIQRSLFELETLNLLRVDNLDQNLPQVLFILRKYVAIIKSLKLNEQQWLHYDKLEKACRKLRVTEHYYNKNLFTNTTPIQNKF